MSIWHTQCDEEDYTPLEETAPVQLEMEQAVYRLLKAVLLLLLAICVLGFVLSSIFIR